MLGLFSNPADDDAVRLKLVVDRLVQKYYDLPPDDLENQVKNDFPDSRYKISDEDVLFLMDEVPSFRFSLNHRRERRVLTVEGGGVYKGFTLFVEGLDWTCAAADDLIQKRTRTSVQLAKALSRKFGIQDMSRDLNRAMRTFG